MPYEAVFISGDFVGEHVGHTADGKFHVGLSGAQEYISDENVIEFDAAYRHRIRTSGRHGRKFELPCAV